MERYTAMRILTALFLLSILSPAFADNECIGTKQLMKYYAENPQNSGLTFELGNVIHEDAAQLLANRYGVKDASNVYTNQAITASNGMGTIVILDAKSCLLTPDAEIAKTINDIAMGPVISYMTILLQMQLAELDSKQEKERKKEQNGPMPQKENNYHNTPANKEYRV